MTTPQAIIDDECTTLLCRMNEQHPGAAVGISLALLSPTTSATPAYSQYGRSGPGAGISPSTVYGIGSVTKVFTATLAALLVGRGAIGDLSTPVGPYLANRGCAPPTVGGTYWANASFLDFATQRSGLPDEADAAYGWQLFTGQPPSCEQIDWWNANASTFAGNEGWWIYSSAGFVTLGFAVAGAAQLPYPTLLTDEITSQLDMDLTFLATDAPAGAQLAQGFEGRATPVAITSAADMKSSAHDMLAWLAAVYQAMQLAADGAPCTVLQQAIADSARVWIEHPLAPPAPGTSKGFAMGLGWQIPTLDDERLGSYQILTKNGAAGGCSCWVGLTTFDPHVPPVGVVLLTNQRGVDPDGPARAILQQIVALAAQ